MDFLELCLKCMKAKINGIKIWLKNQKKKNVKNCECINISLDFFLAPVVTLGFDAPSTTDIIDKLKKHTKRTQTCCIVLSRNNMLLADSVMHSSLTFDARRLLIRVELSTAIVMAVFSTQLDADAPVLSSA